MKPATQSNQPHAISSTVEGSLPAAHIQLHDIEAALDVAKEKLSSSYACSSLDFDIRGELYRLALLLAPHARAQERDRLLEELNVGREEVGVDIAAGNGFLTSALAQLTSGTVYAVDVSLTQLGGIAQSIPNISPLHLSPDSSSLRERIPHSSIDFVTSLGGLHHVSSHDDLFMNVRHLLKPHGRFIAADVCANSSLSDHFDRVVARKCLTGHQANWLSEESIVRLATAHSFDIVACEQIEPNWVFRDIEQMCLFFKALHAYEAPLEEIEEDLRKELGVSDSTAGVAVRWPLLLFALRNSAHY